jgi:hypothetical protein
VKANAFLLSLIPLVYQPKSPSYAIFCLEPILAQPVCAQSTELSITMASNSFCFQAKIAKRSKKTKQACYSRRDVTRRSLRIVVQQSIHDALVHAQSLSEEIPSPSPTLPPPISRRRHRSPPTTTFKLPASAKRVASPAGFDFSNGIPARRKGWYRINAIVDETRRPDRVKYLVEWEGTDPETGMAWPSQWVWRDNPFCKASLAVDIEQLDPKHVSAAAVAFWTKRGRMLIELLSQHGDRLRDKLGVRMTGSRVKQMIESD